MYLRHLSKAFFYQIHTLIADLYLLLLSLKVSISISSSKSRNLGQCLTLPKKGTFFKKGHFVKKKAPKFLPPHIQFLFLIVLHQNKVLNNFRKRGQHLMVEPPKKA